MNIDRLSAQKTIYDELQDTAMDLTQSEIRRTCAHMMFSGKDADKTIDVLSGGEKAGSCLENPA